MKIGCCIPGAPFRMTDGRTQEDNATDVLLAGYRIAMQAGYDYVECGAGMLLRLKGWELAYLADLTRRGEFRLECCNVFVPGNIPLTGPEAMDATEHVRCVFSRMKLLGADTIVFGSGGARRMPAGFASEKAQRQLEEFLAMAGRLGEEYGITVVIEPLNRKECNILNDLPEAAGYVKRVAMPRVKLLADAYHMAAEGEAPEAVETYADILAHVHVAEPESRAYPGSGDGVYLRRMGEALHRMGYTGRVSIECRFDDFAAECIPALAFMRDVF